MNDIFITGIGTEVGKTLVSAIIVEALNYDYWKPIQSGNLDRSDTVIVKDLIKNPITQFHPESYRLTKALSPHAAASIDGCEIELSEINRPQTNTPIVIEGAGGLMVPLNETSLLVDLILKLKVSVVLVAKNYLGSINHTLLSIEALKIRNIPIFGIIFNGDPTPKSEEIILKRSEVKYLGSIVNEEQIDRDCVARYALKFKVAFYDLIRKR